MRFAAVSLGVLALAAAAFFAWQAFRPDREPAPSDSVASDPSPAGPGASRAAAPGPSALVQTGPRAPASVAEPARAAPASEGLVDEAAREYIETLTVPNPEPIAIGAADHFVLADRVLRLDSGRIVEETTLRRLEADATLDPDAPITVVKVAREISLTTPERLIAESAGDLEREIEVLLGEDVRTVPIRVVLEEHASRPDAPIRVIRRVEYLEPTTRAALEKSLAEGAGEWDHMIRVIRKPYRLESTTVADLLAGIAAGKRDSVFYVHSVRGNDVQGVWGIIHDGLIDNFARGMAIRRGEAVNRYRVEIPRDADERQPDNSSSFLGRLIDEKSRASTVYNFRLGRMSRNANLVVPGDEIVIVDFTPEELVNIYQHFLRIDPAPEPGRAG